MDKTTVKVFSTQDNVYEIIANDLDKLNSKNPFGYYFIGASSDVILEIAKSMTKIGKAYIRSNFFAVDEFIVWIFNNLRSGYTFLNSHQEYAIVKDYLYNSQKTEYRKYSKAPSIIKEAIKIIQEINKNLVYKDWDMINKNVKGSGFLKEIQNKLFSKKRIDKAYVYNFFLSGKYKEKNYIDDSELKLLLKDKTLIFYGFLDIPDALREILQRLMENSKESFFYSIYEEGEIFNETKKYMNIFLEHYCIQKKVVNLKKPNIKAIRLKDENLEQDYICQKIKELLKNGIQPEKIGIVCQNNSRAKSLADKMEEYKIPYRLRNNRSLMKSKSIKLIMLPFLIQAGGYRSEDIVSYMESCGNNTIRDLYLNAKLDFFFSNKIEEVKENWNKSILNYIDFLKKKIEIIKKDRENEDGNLKEIENIKDNIEKIEEELKKINDVFKELEEYEIANRDIKKFKEKIESRIEEFRNKLHKENFRIEDEIRALAKFSKVVYEFEEMVTSFSKSFDNLGNLLKEICYLETYIPTEFFNNTVEIFSLDSARYREKEYLFISSFINGEYPPNTVNLLYDDENYKEIFGIQNPYYKIYIQNKLHLYLSMSKTKEAFLTYFEEDKSGNPYTPSVFLNDFVLEKNKKRIEESRILEIDKSLSKTHALAISIIKKKVPSIFKNDINNIKKYVNKYCKKRETIDSYSFDENKIFSFTQFQTYVECPYKYFIKYLLHLKEEKEITFELDALSEGNLMHEALKEFMKKNRSKLKRENKFELIEELKKIIQERFDKYIFSYNKKYMGLWKERVFSYAEKIIKREIKNKYIPTRFESKFDTFKISGITFKGIIDRIDLTSNPTNDKEIKTRVIDYKPSNIGKDKKHKQYQLYIYLLSLERKEEEPMEAYFYNYKNAETSSKTYFNEGTFYNSKKMEENNRITEKTEIEKVFQSYREKFKNGMFNIKIFKANEKKDDPIFSMIIRDENYHNYCNYCLLKNFCNRGEI